MKAAAPALLLLLAACAEAPAGADERIECAIAGGEFQRVCTVERRRSGDLLELVVRRPDGGFRRLVVTDDGGGVAAADGAEPAWVQLVGPGTIEVAIGEDRFRLPATVREAR